VRQLAREESRDARKKRGAFYTPYALARDAVSATLRPFREWKYPPTAIRICDPACGDGAFLAAARDELAALLTSALGCSTDEALARAETQLVGIDINAGAVAAAQTVVPTASVFQADALFGEDYWTGNHAINVFVGNPPFLGGGKIRGVLGDAYFEQIRSAFPDAYRGKADLCTWFFRRAAQAIEAYGCGAMGLIATNTISQGDTREAGLEYLVDRGWQIYDADANFEWPGDAAVSVSRVCMGWWKHGLGAWRLKHQPGACSCGRIHLSRAQLRQRAKDLL
jgi:methylase of polypeptide subunit release factors